MLPNETRLRLELVIRPHQTSKEIIESELRKVNGSIERKWMHLDDFSASWSWTRWKNWKDAMAGEMSYREFLLILQKEFK
jgi:hypothetical protein